MALSTVGYVRFKIYAVLLLVNTSILAVSAHINNFQRFFYRADIFPFALSLITMVFVVTMIFMDVKVKNIVTARPPFELGWLALFGTLWLASNAFSTSRWKYANSALCHSIPSTPQYVPYRTWCNELQVLRVLVWIEWIMFLSTFTYLLRWTVTQRSHGQLHVWSTAFSQFAASPLPRLHPRRDGTDSEFLQWEKFPRPASIPPPSPQVGNREFVRDSYNRDAWQGHSDQYLEPQYTQPAEPHYRHSSQPEYTHSSDIYYTPSPETPYVQSSQGPHPIEVPYMRYPQGQYISPSQTHYPQPYFNGPEHVL